LAAELQSGGSGDLLSEQTYPDAIPVDHPGDLAVAPQHVAVLDIAAHPADRTDRAGRHHNAVIDVAHLGIF
jgi:hypothetical protein